MTLPWWIDWNTVQLRLVKAVYADSEKGKKHGFYKLKEFLGLHG